MSLADELDEMELAPSIREVNPQLEQFERCKAWLEAGLEGSGLSIVDLLKEIAGGAVFWPGAKAAMVTSISMQGDRKVIAVLSAGGDMEEIRKMALGAEAYGRLNGCAYALVDGRRGWERMLKPDGYEFMSVTLRKVL